MREKLKVGRDYSFESLVYMIHEFEKIFNKLPNRATLGKDYIVIDCFKVMLPGFNIYYDRSIPDWGWEVSDGEDTLYTTGA